MDLLGSNDKYTLAGGTSFAALIFAGFVALLNEAENATGQGNINPLLYGLAANPTTFAAASTISPPAQLPAWQVFPSVGPPASQPMPLLQVITRRQAWARHFNALTAAWPASSTASLQTTFVVLVPSTSSATPGQTVSVQINVEVSFNAPGSSVPTGSVSVAVDDKVVDASLAVTSTGADPSAASANYNLVAPATAGSHLVTVTYPGDATHAPATATFSVMVGNVARKRRYEPDRRKFDGSQRQHREYRGYRNPNRRIRRQACLVPGCEWDLGHESDRLLFDCPFGGQQHQYNQTHNGYRCGVQLRDTF